MQDQAAQLTTPLRRLEVRTILPRIHASAACIKSKSEPSRNGSDKVRLQVSTEASAVRRLIDRFKAGVRRLKKRRASRPTDRLPRYRLVHGRKEEE